MQIPKFNDFNKVDEKKSMKVNEVKKEMTLTEATEYAEFFNKKMKDYGVNSPSELSDDEKKKFFDEIEKEWTKDSE